jgi:DNA-binding response OmpR family regulator
LDILLVEDDVRLSDALSVMLRRRGHEVVRALSGADALAAPSCDLVLLDLGLPDCDGLKLCQELQHRTDVAVIAITARGSEMDRVIGLRTGADDYLVKPFSTRELEARIEAVMRRRQPRRAGVLRVGALRVDLDSRAVTVTDRQLSLTAKEYGLLVALAREPDVAISRDRLILEVWRSSWPGAPRTLEVHMGGLRRKVGAALRIETVRGVGYRLVATGPGVVEGAST